MLDNDRARAGSMCLRHAGRLTAPQGWWLDDRRIEVPELFHATLGTVVVEVAGAATFDSPPLPKRRRRRKATAIDLPVPETDMAVAVALRPDALVAFRFDPDEPAVVAVGAVIVDELVVVEDAQDEVVAGEVLYEGSIVVEDDATAVNPLLEPSTPLLARAFVGTARTDRPHHRSRRNGSGGEPGEPTR